ncbi:carbohydrate ABC transporter permease, partial [Pseudomonas aeruginosa]
VFTVPSVVLTMAVALGLAVLLAGDGRLQVNARTLLVIPFAMSPALIGISWRFMLNPEFGAVDALLKAVMPGWSGAPVLADPVLAMAALILVDVWH